MAATCWLSASHEVMLMRRATLNSSMPLLKVSTKKPLARTSSLTRP